jgi:uncharacterized protein (UPF0332 family)
MTLQNLAKIGRLHPHETTPEEIRRLLAAAERNLKDARLKANSPETRFDCAYKAIMQCALVAMMANGFRPATHEPGHHQTMIQSLPLTLGISNDTWIVLDGLRKKRNQSDYTGAPTAQAEVSEGINQATALLSAVRVYINSKRPDLLG